MTLQQGQTEDELAFYKSVANHSLDMITILDASGMITYQSPAITRILGLDPEIMLGESAFDYIHPEDVAQVEAAIERLFGGKLDTEDAEYRFKNSNDEYRRIHSVAKPWAEAGMQGIIVTSRDITEQSEAYTLIAKNNELLSRTFSVSQNLLSITLPTTGEFLEVNDAWCNATGWKRDEVIGRTANDIGIWGGENWRGGLIEDLIKNEQLHNYQKVAYFRDGKPRHLVVDAQLLKVADQPRVLMSCQDVTEPRHCGRRTASGAKNGQPWTTDRWRCTRLQQHPWCHYG